eukprot:gene9741-6829_t
MVEDGVLDAVEHHHKPQVEQKEKKKEGEDVIIENIQRNTGEEGR